jgi:hypothetical protein
MIEVLVMVTFSHEEAPINAPCVRDETQLEKLQCCIVRTLKSDGGRLAEKSTIGTSKRRSLEQVTLSSKRNPSDIENIGRWIRTSERALRSQNR